MANTAPDTVWHWLLRLGPHGSSFNWCTSRFGDLRLLQEFIAEYTETDPDFAAKARHTALEALVSDCPNVIRRGLQILAVVGRDEDNASVEGLLDHLDEGVGTDARCCLFVRGIKRPGGKSKR